MPENKSLSRSHPREICATKATLAVMVTASVHRPEPGMTPAPTCMSFQGGNVGWVFKTSRKTYSGINAILSLNG